MPFEPSKPKSQPQAPQQLKYNLTWRDIENAVESLQQKLDQIKWSPKLIVGVGRGGLLPAIMVSHRLNVPLSIIVVSSYNENGKSGQPTLRDPMLGCALDWKELQLLNTNQALVVDDLFDTGKTMHTILKHMPEAKYATLFQKFSPSAPLNAQPQGHLNWFHRGMATPHNQWVVFPWEH